MYVSPDGNCRYALSTLVFIAHAQGYKVRDASLEAACEAVRTAESEEAGEAASTALIELVSKRVDDAGTSAEAISALITAFLSADIDTTFGSGTRTERLKKVRSHQFRSHLPWLAQIYERQGDGTVGPSWLLIDEVTDRVWALDPNPWDDIPDARSYDTQDFQVLWELSGCNSIAVT